jgi:thiol-disulfide isomerase/thioredoxin
MKRVILFLIVFICIFKAFPQQPFKEVKVGEKIPDLSLGTVINNYTGKTRFSDFKGKLIILDFWSTYCTSCMAAFSYMAEIQQKFGDRIQIFLVNRSQTQEQISQNLSKAYLKKYGFPNLPSIVNAYGLGKMFPHGAEPYHVWIDGNGIVRLAGTSLNTYNEQKIKDVLAGKSISYLKGFYKYDTTKTFASLAWGKTPGIVQYSSLITAFTDTLANENGADGVHNKVDFKTGTIRNAYLNREVLQLYKAAIPMGIEKKWRETIITWSSIKGIIKLFVKDTLRYSADIASNRSVNDDTFKKYRFCYEQIAPKSITEDIRRQYMLEDLNRYFGVIYGAQGKIEKRVLSCYVLLRNLDEDKLFVQKEEEINAKFSLRQQLVPILDRLLPNKWTLVINETGVTISDNIVSLKLTKDIGTMEELRKALQVYGLDIVKTERELPVLVICENDYIER